MEKPTFPHDALLADVGKNGGVAVEALRPLNPDRLGGEGGLGGLWRKERKRLFSKIQEIPHKEQSIINYI